MILVLWRTILVNFGEIFSWIYIEPLKNKKQACHFFGYGEGWQCWLTMSKWIVSQDNVISKRFCTCFTIMSLIMHIYEYVLPMVNICNILSIAILAKYASEGWNMQPWSQKCIHIMVKISIFCQQCALQNIYIITRSWKLYTDHNCKRSLLWGHRRYHDQHMPE